MSAPPRALPMRLLTCALVLMAMPALMGAGVALRFSRGGSTERVA